MITEMPSFDEVYNYAQKQVKYAISKKAPNLPYEQKEEIVQGAMIRVWKAFQKIDPTKGWKSFIQTHCNGTVLDYLKGGDRDIAAELDMNRYEISSESGDQLEAEHVIAIMGTTEPIDEAEDEDIVPNWDLLSRMVGRDENLHIVCKLLQGYSQEAISEQFTSKYGKTISRERIAQKAYELINKLDSVAYLRDPWVNQCIFALGLSKRFHMEPVDNGLGWDLEPIDIFHKDSFQKLNQLYTPSFFDLLVN